MNASNHPNRDTAPAPARLRPVPNLQRLRSARPNRLRRPAATKARAAHQTISLQDAAAALCSILEAHHETWLAARGIQPPPQPDRLAGLINGQTQDLSDEETRILNESYGGLLILYSHEDPLE